MLRLGPLQWPPALPHARHRIARRVASPVTRRLRCPAPPPSAAAAGGAQRVLVGALSRAASPAVPPQRLHHLITGSCGTGSSSSMSGRSSGRWWALCFGVLSDSCGGCACGPCGAGVGGRGAHVTDPLLGGSGDRGRGQREGDRPLTRTGPMAHGGQVKGRAGAAGGCLGRRGLGGARQGGGGGSLGNGKQRRGPGGALADPPGRSGGDGRSWGCVGAVSEPQSSKGGGRGTCGFVYLKWPDPVLPAPALPPEHREVGCITFHRQKSPQTRTEIIKGWGGSRRGGGGVRSRKGELGPPVAELPLPPLH